MPLATPVLHQLRLETGIKPGEWSVRVKASRAHYLNVERQRVVGSPELFHRCATELTQELGRPVNADDLMAAKGDARQDKEPAHGRDLPRHTTAGGSSTEAEETEAAEAEAPTEETRAAS
jgi:hypothetical protein